MISVIHLPLQENTTLPVGPQEECHWWFARARVGVSTCSIFVWGRNQGHGRFFTYSSRVLEKSVDYSMAIFADVMTRIDLTGVKRVGIWSDTGGHFRAYKALATTAYYLVDKYRVSFQNMFGLEHHFKSHIDAYFSRLNAWREQAALTKVIKSISDLMAVFNEAARFEMDRDEYRPEENFIELMPCPKKHVKICDFSRASLPCNLKASYCWSYTLVDERRTSLLGRGLGLSVCARLLLLRVLTDSRRLCWKPSFWQGLCI